MAGHRYWRLFINAVDNSTANYCTIVEVELRTSAGGADITTPSTPVTASSSYPGNPANYAVDNNTSSYWSTANANVSPSNPGWLVFDLGTPQTIVQLSITSLGGFANRAPKSFALQSSDDGTTWPAFTQTIPDQTGWSSAGETRVFTIATSNISGNAKLDTGAAASLVQVFNWSSPYNLIGTVVPALNGDWSLSVIVGTKALVVFIGPSGYQPIAHGPIDAVN